MSDYSHDIAQICKNGHVITTCYSDKPAEHKNFCPSCGDATIIKCPSCEATIVGSFYKTFINRTSGNELLGIEPHTTLHKTFMNDIFIVPAYCHNCGEPYPWTSKFLKAADEMVDMFDDLTSEQKQTLKSTFPDLIIERPESQLAALRASKIINGLQEFGKDILVNLLSENVLPTLFTLMQLK